MFNKAKENLIRKNCTDSNHRDIFINVDKLNDKYKRIGRGCEGKIYRYNSKYSLKIFHNREFKMDQLQKISAMFNEKDPSFCFPMGFVKDYDGNILGYYTELVKYYKALKDFNSLERYDDLSLIIDYIIQADNAIRRAHDNRIILGDIKGDNIMINKKGIIKFVDTNNYKYKDFDFNLKPINSMYLNRAYKNNNLKDNDIFIFSLFSLFLLTKNYVFSGLSSAKAYNRTINKWDINGELKEGLELIFSDYENKPYFGDILKLFTEEDFVKIKKKS